MIYLDNAATTKIDDDVLQAMLPHLLLHYGNPSSVHSIGRKARLTVEQSRKGIASLLGVKPQSIVFTSGGTESNNMAILSAIRDLGCDQIITSKIEHHAVLHTVEYYAGRYQTGVSYVRLYDDGSVDQDDLSRLLEQAKAEGKKCLVSLMHANNETGQLTDIASVASLCRKHNAIFHCDCVQTIGHYPMDLSTLGVHMASASSHKFHGPQGIGLLYVEEGLILHPLIHGGGHERGLRAGTENVAGIVGMAKALEQFTRHFNRDQEYIHGLKTYLMTGLKNIFQGMIINGSEKNSHYAILSVSIPKNEKAEMLLMELDRNAICAAGGSACSGGGSHVMMELGRAEKYVTIRFSFGKYNTREEMDTVVEVLKGYSSRS